MRPVAESLSALYLAEEPGAVLGAIAAVEALSSGRVRRPERVNRRTGMPERDGLFCARIFGPTEDLRCLCGKLVGPEYAGQSCDRCGVLCGERRLRGERWGHIVSPMPLIHPRLAPQIAAALGCRAAELLRVLRLTPDILADGEVTPPAEGGRIRGIWQLAARLGEQAAGLLLTRVPVTPPDWRGTRGDPQDAGYTRLLNRCVRLERLLELNAPQIILDYEALMTQEAFGRLHAAVGAELRARGPVIVAPHTPRAAALLAAIYERPADDGPRLDYAAHLDAAGDPRGEFIRLQLAGRGSKRQSDLLRRNYDRWLGPLAGITTEVGFRRGFLAQCKVPADCRDPAIGAPIWATVEQLDTQHVELVTDPVMRGLKRLALPFRAALDLCQGDHVLSWIDTLELRLARCPPPMAEPVTRGEALPGLRALTLVHRSVTGVQDWRWFDGTPLAGQIERLRLVLALGRMATLPLPWWIGFMGRHPRLCVLDIELGKRQLELELRRDGEWLTLRVRIGRALVERLAMGDTALATSLGGFLIAVDPGSIVSLRVDCAVSWAGEALTGLAAALRARFGALLTLPAIT